MINKQWNELIIPVKTRKKFHRKFISLFVFY